MDKHYSKAGVITAEIDTRNSLFFPPSESNTNNRRGLTLLPKSKEEELDDLSRNITKDKEVVKENTRLPDNFIENLMEKSTHYLKRKIFESYENSDVVKLLKEV